MQTLSANVVVMGAGPAGLGAGLAAARAGMRTVVVEASDSVGGLCRTLAVDGLRFDLGGHIPFVRDDTRHRWLGELLGDDLRWVPRPVRSWRDGLRDGRYLDQRPAGPLGSPVHPDPDPPSPLTPASAVLGPLFGASFVDRHMRPYLEKVDGAPLEQIPGVRALRLMRDQAAPEGFWFPRLGIGQLMDAMAEAITAEGGLVATDTGVEAIDVGGGAVRGVVVTGPEGPVRFSTPSVVVAAAAGRAASLLHPHPPALDPVRMRAVCIVMAAVEGERLTDEAWVQVDDPRVPAGRIFEMGNWSRDMTPGETVMGFECYCRADDQDPVWGLGDEDLTAACIRSLREPLGWLDDPRRARGLMVLRLPRAYPAPEISQLAEIGLPAEILRSVDGIHLAPGAAVIEAIEAGEAAVAAAIAG
ncbi:MAG: FAD-dependent oxidoreductase [Thermoleophilia bacterium]|nr:FAD-dependent oxidoreductase [Thermoleophilia bacterium]